MARTLSDNSLHSLFFVSPSDGDEPMPRMVSDDSDGEPGAELRMVVPSVSAVFRFAVFAVLPFRRCACSLQFPVSVLPFQPTQRVENSAFRFEGHAKARSTACRTRRKNSIWRGSPERERWESPGRVERTRRETRTQPPGGLGALQVRLNPPMPP